MLVMKFQSTFFDWPRIIRMEKNSRPRVLSRAGAFIRQRARSSIKKRKAISSPGKPPSSHEGTLRRYLYFGYDAHSESVVIGPAATNQLFFDRHRMPVRGTIPSVLEYGGQITILEVFKYGKWRRADLRSRIRIAGLPTRYRTVNIKPRPFMGPAFEAEMPNFPELWRDSIKQAA